MAENPSVKDYFTSMKNGRTGINKSLIDQLNSFGEERRPFLAIISYDGSEGACYPLDSLPENVAVSFPHFSKGLKKPLGLDCQLTSKHVPYAQYQSAFQKVQYHLHRGDTYLTNLTCETEVTSQVTLKELFTESRAKYRLLVDNQFTFFSPESFVTISEEGEIKTFPMKGTIDASIPNAKEKLLESKKEQEEHATVVDLLRNDLSIVAEDVQVPRFRYVEKLSTNRGELLQVSSEVSGNMQGDWQNHLGDVFNNILPAGSITGAPKPQTVQIINDCETRQRGFYTGVTILYDGRTVDSCVNIRFIEAKSGQLYYHSGGGITSQSICDDEYHEMESKVYVPTT